jgi:hypothetical protein
MPPQRILPHPLCAFALLGLERVRVADFARPDARVLYAGEQVEADFCGRVAGDAALEDGDDFVGEFRGGAGAVADGGGLEAVEFVEGVVY